MMVEWAETTLVTEIRSHILGYVTLRKPGILEQTDMPSQKAMIIGFVPHSLGSKHCLCRTQRAMVPVTI